jgi:ketopantoate reductase
MAAQKGHIVILGAGSIGCWVGGELALEGSTRVSFIHRDSPTGRAMHAAVCAHGLTLEIFGERGVRTLPASFCREAFTTDAADRLRSATAVLVVTKRHANPTVAPLLAQLAPAVPIYLLQNGLNAPEQLRQLLSAHAAHGVDASERVIEQVVVAISATLVHAEGRVVRSGAARAHVAARRARRFRGCMWRFRIRARHRTCGTSPVAAR